MLLDARSCCCAGALLPRRTSAIFCSVFVAASLMLATWSSSQRMHCGPSFSCKHEHNKQHADSVETMLD
jgi:hypothetical protein